MTQTLKRRLTQTPGIDHKISPLTKKPGDRAVWTTNAWPVLTFIMCGGGHISNERLAAHHNIGGLSTTCNESNPWLRVDKSLTAFRINFLELREPGSYLVIDHSVNP